MCTDCCRVTRFTLVTPQCWKEQSKLGKNSASCRYTIRENGVGIPPPAFCMWNRHKPRDLMLQAEELLHNLYLFNWEQNLGWELGVTAAGHHSQPDTGLLVDLGGVTPLCWTPASWCARERVDFPTTACSCAGKHQPGGSYGVLLGTRCSSHLMAALKAQQIPTPVQGWRKRSWSLPGHSSRQPFLEGLFQACQRAWVLLSTGNFIEES